MMTVPQGWENKPIEKLVAKVMDFRGKTPLKIGMDWGGGMISSLSANNVQMGKIDFTKDNHLASEELYEKWMNKGTTQKNDIVFTMEAPLGNVALIPDNKKYLLSQRVILLRPASTIQSQYFFNYLMSDSFQSTLLKYSSGSTVKGIQYSKLKEIKILYPIEKLEQQKIASILSGIDRAIEATQTLIDKEKMIKKALMADLLNHGIDEQGCIRKLQTHRYVESSLGMIPEGWEVKRLGELVDIVGGGTPVRDIKEYWEKGTIPWVTVKDLHHKLEISDSEEKITEFGLTNSAANLISPNNIITPTRMSIGRFFINTVPITINQDLKALKPKKVISPLFLLWNLLQYGIKLEALGTGTTVKGITLPDLKNLRLPVPPLPEQQKIAQILSSQDHKIETEEANLAKLQYLKKALMADLLSGKVRVK